MATTISKGHRKSKPIRETKRSKRNLRHITLGITHHKSVPKHVLKYPPDYHSYDTLSESCYEKKEILYQTYYESFSYT